MALILVLLVGLGIYDIRKMLKEKDVRQAVLYCMIGIMAFVFGIWVIQSRMEHSFCYELFHLLGIIERQ